MASNGKISAAEHCYRELTRRIISLELKPNETIGEHALAQLLGVSRTPVREALTRLSAERLVDLRARAGAVVAPIRIDAVRTAQFVREKLEMGIMAEAAARRDANRRVSLGIRQAIEEQELARLEGEHDAFFEADERMHNLFCQLAGLGEVWDFIADAKKHMDRLRRLSVQTGHLEELIQDHIRINAAVMAGDAVRAQEAMQVHLRKVMADATELSTRFPAYFEEPARTRSKVPA